MKSQYLLGLIGYPLLQSLSPPIHNAALKASGLDGKYQLFVIPPLPGGGTEMATLIATLRSGELDGLNVTVPHKRAVIPLLDVLTPTAQSIGAVNTIFLENGRLVGDNTDAPGFLASLRYHLTNYFCLTPRHALVLGAGGTARAIVYALHYDGWEVSLAARHIDQAAALLEIPHPKRVPPLNIFPLEATALQNIKEVSLLVNTTPVGAASQAGYSPWPEDLPMPAGCVVYDVIYNPLETRLMCQAQSVGLLAINGLCMLVEQAALSFERWTGNPAPHAAMWKAISQ